MGQKLKANVPYRDVLLANASRLYPKNPHRFAALAAAVFDQESSFDNKRVSPSGCKGIGQLCDKSVLRKFKAKDISVPEENIRVSMEFLADNLNHRWGNNKAYAVAEYHSGYGQTNRAFKKGVLPTCSDGLIRTDVYVAQVLRKQNKYLSS